MLCRGLNCSPFFAIVLANVLPDPARSETPPLDLFTSLMSSCNFHRDSSVCPRSWKLRELLELRRSLPQRSDAFFLLVGAHQDERCVHGSFLLCRLFSLLVDLRAAVTPRFLLFISCVCIFGDPSDCNVNALSLFYHRLWSPHFACYLAFVFSAHVPDPVVNYCARTVQPVLVGFFPPLALVAVVLSVFSVLWCRLL